MTKRIKVNNSKPAGRWGRVSHTTTTRTDSTSSAGTKNNTTALVITLLVILGTIIYIALT